MFQICQHQPQPLKISHVKSSKKVVKESDRDTKRPASTAADILLTAEHVQARLA